MISLMNESFRSDLNLCEYVLSDFCSIWETLALEVPKTSHVKMWTLVNPVQPQLGNVAETRYQLSQTQMLWKLIEFFQMNLGNWFYGHVFRDTFFYDFYLTLYYKVLDIL